MVKKVLAIGRESKSLKRIERSLKLKGYEVMSCASDDSCIKEIKSSNFDALIIDSEVEIESKAILKQFSKEQKPNMIIVETKITIEDLVNELESAFADQ
jgi:DNA-binding NtrC family response regulator